MDYKDYIAKMKQTWVGRKVSYDGKEYTVMDVDYNGMLLINKHARFTDTTAISIFQIDKENKK